MIHDKFKILTFNLLLLLLLFLVGACSNMRYLQEGQQLYTGSKVRIEAEEKINNKSEVASELERVIRPQPNNKFLFWRTRLWFYNIAGESPSTRPGRWIKNTIGRPPVLWEDFSVNRSVRLIENRLFNIGFFDPQIVYQIKESEKKVSVGFSITLQRAYTIKEVLPMESKEAIAQQINESLEKSLLREGRPYQLAIIRQERERITNHLKDLGYYYFHPDFLLFRADTTVGDREVSLSLTLKPNIPDNALYKYSIRNIHVNTNHALEDSSTQYADTLYLENGMHLINNQNLFKSSTIQKAIFFEQGELYNTRDHDLTLNHLMGLGVFKFVNLRFSESQFQDKSSLDVRILLSPMQKKTIGAELRGVSKSTGFVGPGLSLSFTNRNFLSGAEHFSLSIDGSFETLLGQRQRDARSAEVGASAELSIPRFVAPFGLSDVSPLYIPRTRISLSFNFLNRTDAFSVSSIRSMYAYEWRQSVTSSYRYAPFVINIFSLGNISDQYEQFFSREVLLRRGLFEQFLLGSEFSYYWNTQLRGSRKHAWYFNYNLDLSGNVAYLLLDKLNLASEQDEGGYGIFNQSFSQYTKTDFDVRYFLDLGHGRKIATRFIAGLGVSYGNSTTLPYVKLFTTGGSNSIRAFHPRSLGPGSYSSPDTLLGSFDIYQSGDIKLEFSSEYRFRISNIFKGAVFVDAGNVWNRTERERASGGQFDSSEFLSQVALGTGVGLRMDFTFFLLRLDLAFPLAVPYDDSSRYFQDINILDGSWRKNNLLLNLAIGYPF